MKQTQIPRWYGEQGLTAVVADRYPLYARSLSRLLRLDLDVQVLAVADDINLALALFEQTQPTLAILDRDLAGSEFYVVLDTIRETCPRTRLVVVLSAYESTDIIRMRQTGAIRCVLKSASADQMRDLLKDILRPAAQATCAAF